MTKVSDRTEVSERSHYEAPILTELGTFEQLTQAAYPISPNMDLMFVGGVGPAEGYDS